MAQKITWRADDTPDFGQAFKLGRLLDGPSREKYSWNRKRFA